jgi:hypothetical protein
MGTRLYNLSTQEPGFEPVGVCENIKGGRLATQSTRDAALVTQMRCTNHGRRIVCRGGIQGQPSTFVISGVDPEIPGQVYPLATAERILARQRVRVTPGYYFQIRGLFLPTGPAQQFTLGEWKEGKPGGSVRIDVTWSNGFDTSSNSVKINPAGSLLEYKALPTATGGCWDVLEVKEASLFSPQEPGWTEGLTADITIVAIGGARPLDIVVYESPALAVHDDTHREGTVSGYVSPLPIEYPITGQSYPTQAVFGSHQANKSIGDQRSVWGPVLFNWSSWNEDTAAVTATEGAAVSVTQTAFRDLSSTGITSYASTNPGWSVASGAYARNIEQSGSLELRDKNGCIPVTVRAWARVTSVAHTGTIRFQTADYAYRDLTVTGSTAFQWYSGLAWIRVPVHASLDSLLQVLCKVGGVGQVMEVRHVSVEYGDGHAVEQ